jgi:catechol 2,3-dioxygenase-like lactoylglutathione lyase family enzyme
MLEGSKAVATIAVSDLDRAKTFYGETLGLPMHDERAGGVLYETGGTSFLVYPSQFAGTSQSTLMSFDVEDFDQTMKEMREAGVTFEEYDFPGLKTVEGVAEIEGVRSAWFKDPDGNILALGQRES